MRAISMLLMTLEPPNAQAAMSMHNIGAALLIATDCRAMAYFIGIGWRIVLRQHCGFTFHLMPTTLHVGIDCAEAVVGDDVTFLRAPI